MEFDKKLPLSGAQVGVVTMSCKGDADTHWKVFSMMFSSFHLQSSSRFMYPDSECTNIYDIIFLTNRQFRFLFYFCFFEYVLKHVSLGRSRQ